MGRRFLLGGLLMACGDNTQIILHDAPTDDSMVCEPVFGTSIGFHPIAYGCGEPGAQAAPFCTAGAVTLVTSPPNDSRLFVLEVDGRIRIIEHGELRAGPFLDLSQD